MQDADIYLKTDAGRDEIKSRSRGLSMATRAILLMVDGQRSVAALRTVIAGSKAPDDTLEMLVAQGLIEARAAPASPPSTPSISTPRSATMARSTDPLVVVASESSSSSRPAPPPDVRGSAYDAPLDLVLPTIHGPASSFVAAGSGEAEPRFTSATRYEHLYTMMNEIVRDFLPAHRRYFIQLKIERCGTAGELIDMLGTLQAALVKARGDTFANEVVSRLRIAASDPVSGDPTAP